MNVGTVFRWNDFPNPQYGNEIKARWFIYLGETGPFHTPTVAYLPTTTTQLQRFEPGGPCCNHSHHLFRADSSCFEEDCIIDFDSRPYTIKKQELIDNPDIEIRGQLKRHELELVYSRILRSSAYPKKIVSDIHESLNREGLTGFKKPK